MRIYLAFLQSPHFHPHHVNWPATIKAGLEEAGHQWLEDADIDWGVGLYDQMRHIDSGWKSVTWPQVVRPVRRHHEEEPVDLFLGYFFPGMVDVRAIEAIRAAGVPCVNFFCDHLKWLTEVPPDFAAFDLHWVAEMGAVSMYEERGFKALLAPMPAWAPPDR